MAPERVVKWGRSTFVACSKQTSPNAKHSSTRTIVCCIDDADSFKRRQGMGFVLSMSYTRKALTAGLSAVGVKHIAWQTLVQSSLIAFGHLSSEVVSVRGNAVLSHRDVPLCAMETWFARGIHRGESGRAKICVLHQSGKGAILGRSKGERKCRVDNVDIEMRRRLPSAVDQYACIQLFRRCVYM